MAQFDKMATQLEAALDRLEEVTLPFVVLRTQAAKDAAEIASLKAEREHLLSRIAELEDESRALASVADEVEVRLDDAITEIRTALAR